MTAEVVRRKLQRLDVELEELRTDLIGVNSIFGEQSAPISGEPPEVRLRIAGRALRQEHALALEAECEDMWFGPIGGGGVRTSTRPLFAMYSTLVPRDRVPVTVRMTERSDEEMTL